MRNNIIGRPIALILALMLTTAMGSKLQELSLNVRVHAAALVCVAKVANKEVKGDWAYADLVVERGLKNTGEALRVPVVWRTKVNGRALFDVDQGFRGIAILKDKHEGRYWLRSDRLVDLEKLDDVVAIIEHEERNRN